MNSLSLGAKLAALNIAVLAACSIAIAGALNFSALTMADAIEAQVMLPAQSIDDDLEPAGSVAAIPEQPQTAATPNTTEETTAGELAPSEARADYLASSVGTVALFVCVGAAATYLLVKRETRGIEQLAHHLRSCSPDDLAQPLRILAQNRETASLVDAFNSMGLRASDAIASQRRFALAAAHEFKTPLAAMRARLDVFAKRKSPTAEDIERLTSTLSTQTDRLSALVSQLLVLARSSTAERNELVDPSAIVLDIAEEIHAKTGIEVEVSNRGARHVMADRELMVSAVRNALENAVTHGHPPYRALCCPGSIVISNAGNPISTSDREALFEPLRRGDGSRSRSTGGCGLGLATTREIMRAHGGDARFLPVKSGVSLELSFSLPPHDATRLTES
ncbi:MAG: HAMP domain-containing sensor histidine kinase [Slackia sp.]|nr:HAMP domain-containing sensor histidine kinase [Slackia sp.]